MPRDNSRESKKFESRVFNPNFFNTVDFEMAVKWLF